MLLPSCVLCKLPISWLLGCEFLLSSLANIHAVSFVASSLPRPYPSPADSNKEGKTMEGSTQIILSKNACIPSPSRPCPESSRSPTRWFSSLAGEWRCRWCWRKSCQVWRGGECFSDDKRRVGGRNMSPPTTHSSGTCLNLLTWAPQGITKTEISFYKLLITKWFQT